MRLLEAAKRDERQAPGNYKRLLRVLHSPREKRIVRGIITDEKKHLNLLKTIRR